MESVEELCDHIALIHQSNKILDGKLQDIKRQFKTNTFEVGLVTNNELDLTNFLKEKFEVSKADYKSLNNDLKLNIKLNDTDTSNDLLRFLTAHAEVNHFNELVPTANDIFIQTVKNS
tara:strand:- start:10570 stop:10923 length:354 start_codon:yes stop_codon:yes gene_type:complete